MQHFSSLYYIYVVNSISFQTFFVKALKIVVDCWEFSMLLLYILWDDWLTNFYDFSFKWTATAAIGIHPTKAWLSQLVNFKMQSDTLEERYAIKLCFKLGKNAIEIYGMLQTAFGAACMNRAWVFEWHKRFKEGRESVRGVGRVSKSIHHSWLAKGLGLGLLCWGFKGVQEEIPSEEASTL